MNFKSVICGEFPKLLPRGINSIRASALKPFIVAKKTTATDALMELIQRSAELIKCKSLILLIWCTVLYFSIRTDVYLFIKIAKTCIFPKKPTRTVNYSATALARTSGHPWLQGFLLLQRDGTTPPPYILNEAGLLRGGIFGCDLFQRTVFKIVYFTKNQKKIDTKTEIYSFYSIFKFNRAFPFYAITVGAVTVFCAATALYIFQI